MPDIKLTQAGARILIVASIPLKLSTLQARVLVIPAHNLGAMTPGKDIAY